MRHSCTHSWSNNLVIDFNVVYHWWTSIWRAAWWFKSHCKSSSTNWMRCQLLLWKSKWKCNWFISLRAHSHSRFIETLNTEYWSLKGRILLIETDSQLRWALKLKHALIWGHIDRSMWSCYNIHRPYNPIFPSNLVWYRRCSPCWVPPRFPVFSGSNTNGNLSWYTFLIRRSSWRCNRWNYIQLWPCNLGIIDWNHRFNQSRQLSCKDWSQIRRLHKHSFIELPSHISWHLWYGGTCHQPSNPFLLSFSVHNWKWSTRRNSSRRSIWSKPITNCRLSRCDICYRRIKWRSNW